VLAAAEKFRISNSILSFEGPQYCTVLKTWAKKIFSGHKEKEMALIVLRARRKYFTMTPTRVRRAAVQYV